MPATNTLAGMARAYNSYCFKPRKSSCPDELTSHLTKRGKTCAKSLVNERHEKTRTDSNEYKICNITQ